MVKYMPEVVSFRFIRADVGTSALQGISLTKLVYHTNSVGDGILDVPI